MTIRDALLAETDDNLIFLGSDKGEFDDAIIGTSFRNSTTVLVYDADRVIARLTDMGMTDEEAWEWFSVNIESSNFGDRTPIYVMPRSHYV